MGGNGRLMRRWERKQQPAIKSMFLKYQTRKDFPPLRFAEIQLGNNSLEHLNGL
jgi:hypothetical protein